MSDPVGQVLLNRFRVDALLSQDELGTIYRGLDLKRNIPLAIKILQVEVPYDPQVISFQQDNLTLQTLSHPHIVPFYGLYQAMGLNFLVEKFIHGQSLQEILLARSGKPATTAEALTYLKALSSALGYIHGLGLIHCDIKPNNILIENDGNILLAGFAFARSADSPMTRTGVAGLPIYQAPEQILGRTVSPPTDIYALGLLLYELLTGQHPFLGVITRAGYSGAAINNPASAERVRQAHLTQLPPDPRRINPNISPSLAQAVLTALNKEASQRYLSTQEMLEITCAVAGVTPDQVADRFPATPAAGGTLVVAPVAKTPQPGATPYQQGAPGTAQSFSSPGQSGTPAGQPGRPPQTPPTQVSSPAYPQPGASGYPQPGAPGYPPGQIGRTPVPPTVQAAPPSYAGASPYPQSVPGAQPPYPPSQAGATPYSPATQLAPSYGPSTQAGGTYDIPLEAEPRQNVLPWKLIIGIGAGLVLCVILAAIIAVPILGSLGSTATPTITQLIASATSTFTVIPPSATSANVVASPPPAQFIATDTPPPTATPPPTNTPPPTATRAPTDTPMANSFKVTIRNNLGNNIYAFRDGRLMGTDPIPPGRYIWYSGIPRGTYTFSFCTDPNMGHCVAQKKVTVDQDLTINVP